MTHLIFPRIVESIPPQGSHGRCNNADKDWCVRMPTNPLPVDPKIEILLKLCEEEDVILEPTFPAIDNWLPH